jgi:hypothetical protein
MATARKPAASKPTTARKPAARKPAAKKTVPAEELLEAKIAVSAPEPQPRDSESDLISTPAPVYTQDQQQALLETYFTLKNAGLHIPDELRVVETWVTQQQEAVAAEAQHAEEAQAERVEQANARGPWYVRNNHHTPFNFRLDRQTEKRRIELKPRGVPGDLHPIKDEDLRDPCLIANQQLGLLEIVPAGEAQLIIEKQTYNSGQRVHTPLAIIQQEYQQHATRDGMNVSANPTFKVETEYNQQGVTVAYTDPNVLQGNLTDTQVKRSQLGGLTRPGTKQPAPTVHSAFVPTGGNPAVVSQGNPAAQQRIQADISRRAVGQKEQNMHAGPGELTVTVNPTQRT